MTRREKVLRVVWYLDDRWKKEWEFLNENHESWTDFSRKSWYSLTLADSISDTHRISRGNLICISPFDLFTFFGPWNQIQDIVTYLICKNVSCEWKIHFRAKDPLQHGISGELSLSLSLSSFSLIYFPLSPFFRSKRRLSKWWSLELSFAPLLTHPVTIFVSNSATTSLCFPFSHYFIL